MAKMTDDTVKTVTVHGQATAVLIPPADPKPATPPPTGPPMTIDDIPDGDPATVAARLLHRLRPGVADETAGRIAHLRGRLDDAVERARLGETRPNDFIKLAASLVVAIDALEARLALADGGDAPTGSSVDHVADLVLSVARYRDGDELPAERTSRVEETREELRKAEHRLDSLLRSAEHTRVASKGHPVLRLNLSHTPDVWAQDLADGLARRPALRARLAALGGDADERAAVVKSAVDAAGRDVVKSAVIKSIPVVDRAAPRKARLAQVEKDLGWTDPESKRAAALRDEQARLQAELAELATGSDADRVATAGSLLSRAESGDLAAIVDVARRVRGEHPELADALLTARGSRDQLRNVAREMAAEALAVIGS